MAENIESVSVYTADISQLSASFNELMQQITKTREEMQKAKGSTAEYNALAQKLTQQEKALAKAFKDGTMQIDKNTVSYRQLNNVLKDLKKTYKDVGTEEERKELTQGIQAFDKELKSMDADIGVFNRNVGNYAGALGNVSQVILGQVSDLGILDKNTTSLFIKLSRDIPKLISSLGQLENMEHAVGVGAENAGAKSTKALTNITSKLGALAIAVAAAAAVYKLFQSEIDRGLRKVQDWGKAMLGIEDYTINSTKAQKEFSEALAQSTAQLGGQITTYKILETLITSNLVKQQDSAKAASELLKALKETDNATNRAKVANGEYAESIEDLIEMLYKQAEAGAVVEYMTNHIKGIIDMQNQIIELQLKRNTAVQNKEAGRVKGFWNALKAAIIANGGDLRQAIDLVNDGIIDNIDKDTKEIEDKIKEAKEKLPEEFKELLEALFPEGEGGSLIMRALFGDDGTGGPNDKSWYSKMELAIKEAEAMQEDYWKYSKKGYGMYMAMYDEIAEHYKTDEKKYRETLASKKAFHKQYLDYMKKLDQEYADMAEGQMQKDLNDLERWKEEQIKIYTSAGKETTKIEQEYTKRKEKILNQYKDKYEEFNKTYAGVKAMIKNRNEALAKDMVNMFKVAMHETKWVHDGVKNLHRDTMREYLTALSDIQTITQILVNDSLANYESRKSLIIAEMEVRKQELRQQRDNEIFSLKERLGDTEEFEKQKLQIETYYENKIVEVNQRTQNEIASELRAALRRQLGYINDYYNELNNRAALQSEDKMVDTERKDWNHGFGSFSKSMDRKSIQAEFEVLQEQYNNTVKNLSEQQETIQQTLLTDANMSIEERLSLEEEYNSLTFQLEDERLNYHKEKNRLALADDKQLAEDRVQAFQESFNQIGNLFGALYSMYEADAQAQVKEGKITQEEAEKQLERYRGIKAAGAVMDALGSAVGAYKSMASIPYVGPALGAVAAAAALAAGYANVRQILAVKKDNVGDMHDAYKAVVPSQSDYNPTYVTNLTGREDTEYLANALDEKPLKAYVVESDVSDAQVSADIRRKESSF